MSAGWSIKSINDEVLIGKLNRINLNKRYHKGQNLLF